MARVSTTQLPIGTVTFLFTDIEGSTSMLVDFGDRYQELLERHAQLLRDAFRDHGGVEVNTEGDAFFVAFSGAGEALDAVAAGQRALASEAWPERGVIRVRMGLHTGQGTLGGDDYVGLDVNRAARIAGAAHGGQVVLSESTRVLVEDGLPASTALRDLGRHRLKDLPEPEHLWQLEINELPSEFPALRTLDARPTNLPPDLTALIGREAELEAIRGLIGEKRMVTLTGPGGTGKTRLGTAVAASLLDAFGDGVFFVALQDVQDRPAIASEIAASLGVREHPDRDVEQAVMSYLRDREVLLVLDNFEQVVGSAPILTDLLATAPRLRFITTSREALRVTGEQEYPVEPLGLPDGSRDPIEVLEANESVALFLERAKDVNPHFRLSDHNAADVVAICRRLDGLPLAIELAAARIRLLSPGAILDRLDRALPMLVGGGRDRPERQQTLTGAIDWSHELLNEDERRLFARLSVFAGGWTLTAAEQVCAIRAEPGIEVFEGLTSLVEKSLVKTDVGASGDPRFRMLQVIREYAADRLADGDGTAEIARQHALWVAGLAETAEPELIRTELRRWQLLVRDDEDNIRAALRWALARQEADPGLRIAGSLWRFWHYWGEVREGSDWLERVLALQGADAPTQDRAKALSGLAGLRYWQGQAEQADVGYEEALALRRVLGDEGAIAEALRDTYWVALAKGQIDQAYQRSDEAIEHFRAAHDEAGEAIMVAWVHVSRFVMGAGGSYEEAAAATLRAGQLNQASGLIHDASEAMASNAYVHWIAGQFDACRASLLIALREMDEMGHIGRMGSFLKMSAALELKLGRPQRAVQLASSAARHRDELGGEPGGGLLQVGDPLEEAHEELTDREHADAVAAGQRMTFEEAVAYALDEGSP